MSVMQEVRTVGRNGAYGQTPTGKVVPKVEIYGWTVKNNPGRFMMIDKAVINVDHAYQRSNVSNSRVMKIASEWDWIAFGVVIVAVRPDGSFWAIDGQHRKLAADKRSDIRMLPCMLFECDDIVSETNNFLVSNTNRGPVSTLGRFNALIISKDPTALRVKAALDSAGLHASFGESITAVGCVAALLNLFANAEVAAKLWPLILEMSVLKNERMNGSVVEALIELNRRLDRGESEQSLTDSHNHQRLVELGMDGCAKSIAKAKGYFGKGGQRIGAQGIVDALNHRRTSRKLPKVIED